MAKFSQQNITNMEALHEKISDTINEVYGLEVGSTYYVLEEKNETLTINQKIILKKVYSFSKGVLLSVGVGGISDYEEAYIGPNVCIGMLDSDGEVVAKNFHPEVIYKDRDTIMHVIRTKNEESEKAFLKKIIDSVLTNVNGLTIHFNVVNAAYRDDAQKLGLAAVASTIREVASLIEGGTLSGDIMDDNGNFVGAYNIID